MVRVLFTFILSFSYSLLFANDITPDNTLWYKYPAKEWKNQALHIGNGYMGASFYGEVETERFDIAEKTFWAGGPNVGVENNFGIIKGGKDHIDEIRRLILEDKITQADSLCRIHMVGDYSNYGYFSNVGSLLLNFKNQKGDITNYVRMLDLKNSLGKVKYNIDGTNYCREYFCS